MYLPKNSRYVLQKAQWFAPSSCFFTCLKGNEKSLSIRYPKEDPTKPPLRRNIPADSPVEYYPNIVPETHRLGLAQQRSRSLISRSANSSPAVFDDELLPRSESEIQLPKFTSDRYLTSKSLEKGSDLDSLEPPNGLPLQVADEVMGEMLISGKTRNDENPETTDLFYGKDKTPASDKSDVRKTQTNKKETSTGGGRDSAVEDSDYKIVHIIIDIPQKVDENSSLMTFDDKYRENVSAKLPDDMIIARENDERGVQESRLKQSKKLRSKSLARVNAKSKKKRFEVHEIEDSGTYVLHLKFKNTTGVEVVPEKEVRTRNAAIQDFSVRMPNSSHKALRKPTQATAAVEETTGMKKNREKKKKSKPSKHVIKSRSISLPQFDPDTNENVQANEFLEWQQPQYYELPVSDSFEERKVLKAFSKDDYGTIRSTSTDKSTFKIRKTKKDVKGASPVENVGDETKIQMEPAAQPSEDSEKEKASAQAVAEEQANEVGMAERESAPHEGSASALSQVKDEEFTVSSYKDPHRSVERAESALDGTRPPPTDWIVPSFMRATADQQAENETVVEDKPRPKKKVKKFTSNGKKGKGKSKKKNQDSRSKIVRSEKCDSDVTDFKNGASSVSIKCEKPTYAMKLSAAYPPLLNEAMKKRYYGYRRDSAYTGKIGSSLLQKDFEMNPRCTEANPKETSKRDACSGFVKCQSEKERDASKTSSVPKIGDNIGNIANENMTSDKGTTSLDSLAMMKKVKEIVDLDLKNAIKIFRPDLPGVMSSVIISKGDGDWTLDEKELRKCLAIQKSEFLNDVKKAESRRDFLGDEAVNAPKYLPTTKESLTEVKLDYSVVTFNPETNKFIVDVEDLQEAIRRRTEESFDDVVVEKLEGLLTGSKTEPILVFSAEDGTRMELKSGDSILVFDEKTQRWKVDYSILEKREEQMRVEEELTKRSELILETIKKLEKGNVPSIPKPETRDRKTFDYNKEQWKDYGSEKKPKNKMKSPFKESDAEEIRKKNSDLYEDLFVKKDKTKKSNGANSNEVKLCKEAGATESGTTKEPGMKPPEKHEPISQKTETPVAPDQKIEDDNYWEAFLNMNIPARSNKEILDVTEPKKSKIRAPGPPPPPPSTPPTPPTPPVSSPPGPKIEEPKYKIHIPFAGNVKKKKKTSNDNKEISPTKPPSKEEKPKAKGPTSPEVKEKSKIQKSSVPPGKSEKKEEAKVSVPTSPQPSAVKKEEPKANFPLPPSPSKKKDPKTKSSGTAKKEERKEKLIPKKKGEKNVPGSVPPQKEMPTVDNKKEPKVKAPPPASVKSKEDPKTGGRKDKSAADHYVSENIVELSRSSKDTNAKVKSNKVETVKVNITADRRLPSKVTEINLNKKCEKPKESTVASEKEKKIENGVESRIFYRKFEKYKTPFSDPEYEEKSMRIKSDVASNPNLKKLGNWNKTLVLHDVAKPPENIESWLKDETDKMTTLLLKVLQEATDGKPRRKSSRAKLTDKSHPKANPYDNIRKKQETVTRESFLFKVRPVNLSPESDKRNPDQEKTDRNVENVRNLPARPEMAGKQTNVSEVKDEPTKAASGPVVGVVPEGKPPTVGLETMDSLISRDFLQQCRLAGEITDDIPGPEILKKISNTWKVFPIFSVQMTIFTLLRLFQLANVGKSLLDTSNPDKSRRHTFGKLFAKYGPVVNVQGPLSGSVILLYKPEHLFAVFEQDATIPVRSVFDSLEQSRREAEDKYVPTGMCAEWNASQWVELKRNTDDALTKGREKFFGIVEAAGDSLVSNIRKNKNRQNYASEDFMDEIKRWSLEGLCNVLFEKSFGFLEGRSKNMSWILEPDKLYMSVDEATSYLSKCERGFQTWRLMTTPSAIGLKQSYRTLSGIVAKQIYQAEANLKNKSEMLRDRKMQQTKDLTFLESMLLNDGMTSEEITCNLIDILLIGTNVMSSALGFLLYDLAQNVKVQNKLVSEVSDTLPEKSSRLDYRRLHSLKYLRACLKESLRLHVPVPVFHRMLQNDILLSNYIVPKGTYVVMDYRVSCMKEQIFDEPEKFHPERWLEDEKFIQNFHPFNTLPLCHGPRAELAKRVVEMQILTCVAKIIRNFHVEYPFGEIQATDNVISFPDKPLKFNFIERDF